jgi:hypothetical protein
MRRRFLAATGLCLALAACGTTVPVSSQAAGNGSGPDGSGTGAALPDGSATPAGGTGSPTGSVSDPGTAGSSSTSGAGSMAGSGGGGSAGSTSGTSGSRGTDTRAVTTTVDYSKPATGSPVEVGIMYIPDLGAAAAAFGGDGKDTTDQQGYMRAAVAYMNAHGGLGGHKISLLFYGAEIAGSKSYDQSLSEMCAMMTQDHKVVASVIANITVTNLMAECMQKYKGLYVTDGGYLKTSADWKRLSYTVSPAEIDANLLGKNLAQDMIRKAVAKKGDTVGLIVYDAPGFHAAQAHFEAVAKANGIDVVAYRVHYAQSTPDLANSISAVQSAALAMKARGAKAVASLSSGGMMSYFLQNADSQKYYPKYVLSSLDGVMGAPAIAKNGQLKGSIALGTLPSMDTDLYADPRAFSDTTFATCRAINKKNSSVANATNLSISQRVCNALLLIQTAAKGYGGSTITGTTLRDGLGKIGGRIPSGSSYTSMFTPGKLWAAAGYRSMHYDEAKNKFVYDSGVLPFN